MVLQHRLAMLGGKLAQIHAHTHTRTHTHTHTHSHTHTHTHTHIHTPAVAEQSEATLCLLAANLLKPTSVCGLKLLAYEALSH